MTDHAFIYFAREATEQPKTWPAPFYGEHLKTALKGWDSEAFCVLYTIFDARYTWHNYPILTVRANSIPIYEDLGPEFLIQGIMWSAIGYAAQICANAESRTRFTAALGLTTQLIQSAEQLADELNPVPALVDHLPKIKDKLDRVLSMHEDPNLSYWFSKITQFNDKVNGLN